MPTLTAAEADQRIGARWFQGYTKLVTVIDEACTLDDFDVDARGLEYVLFERGLVVTGTLSLGSDVHSIIVVTGPLHVQRLILGDAAFVVTERVEASELVFGRPNEGVFEVAGHQIEGDRDGFLAAIETPVLVIFDRGKREYMLRERNVERTAADLVDDVLDGDDPSTKLLAERLLAGAPIFRMLAEGSGPTTLPAPPRAKRPPKPTRAKPRAKAARAAATPRATAKRAAKAPAKRPRAAKPRAKAPKRSRATR
jgi:hypothetical protein